MKGAGAGIGTDSDSDWVSTTQYEHGYDVSSPTAEENVGPYYHQFDGEVKIGAPGYVLFVCLFVWCAF